MKNKYNLWHPEMKSAIPNFKNKKRILTVNHMENN